MRDPVSKRTDGRSTGTTTSATNACLTEARFPSARRYDRLLKRQAGTRSGTVKTASACRRFQVMTPPYAAPETGSDDTTIQTILVVEDEVLIRFPLAEYLRECGFRVLEASNVAEAKAVLDADTPVDLVFTDVHLPGNENGFALATWVRQHYSGTKVLLTSGLANGAEKAGDLCDEGPLMAKAYSHATVLRRIQSLLRAERRRSKR